MILHSVSMRSLALRLFCDFLTIPPLYIESAWFSAGGSVCGSVMALVSRLL
jgi:hypothetical protein